MESLQPLAPDLLYHICDPELLPFKTTETLESYSGFFGQERAQEAMQFGVGMQRPGYNLFVMGNPHTGRFSFAMENIKSRAKKEKKPRDWCYLNNFEDERHPICLHLPAGMASKLRRDCQQLIETLSDELPAAFESPSFQRSKSRIEREFNRHYDDAIELVEREARPDSIAVYRDAGSIGFTPVADGQAMDEAQFSQLDEVVRDAFAQRISELEDFLNDQLTGLPQWRRQASVKLKQLEQETARQALLPLLEPLQERYHAQPGIVDYFDRLEKHLVKIAGELMSEDKSAEQRTDSARKAFLEEAYRVNVLVDNDRTKGSPVVYEAHPNYENLFGRVEFSNEMGTLVTGFQKIRAGALHNANGGYLLIDAEKLLQQPYVYGALKRALKAHEIRIENPASEFSGLATVTLNPAAIPLKVKVVLIGGRDTYYLLQELDQDFEKTFRVVVDFDEEVDRNAHAVRSYARLMKTIADEEKLAPLTRGAVSRAIEQSSRQSGDQELISTHIGELVDLLCEADFKRIESQEKLIHARHVEMALAAQERRTGRLAQKILDNILNETVLINTDGAAVGKSNGLTVLQVGDVSFGTPARITATVHPGQRGIVDIEKEVELGRSIHSKGVMILTGYLGHKYAQDFQLTLSAHITMEQSYGLIDGDSASMAEICTLISALTHLPIQQQYAMTGSINQYGEVQAIGGVNEKVEGFFKLCQLRGLTGKQGVIIPQANVRNLMLKREVVDAVKQGQFAIYAVETVDQCLSLLFAQSAGKQNDKGEYPLGSINYQVVQCLKRIAAIANP